MQEIGCAEMFSLHQIPAIRMRPAPCWQVLGLLCAVAEYDEMPVRHNEDKLNLTLSQAVRHPIDPKTADDPHTKTNLLLQVCCPTHPFLSLIDLPTDRCLRCAEFLAMPSHELDNSRKGLVLMLVLQKQ